MSIDPGTSKRVDLDPAIGDQLNLPAARRRYVPGNSTSQTLNPLSPIEYGRIVSGGVADKATDDDGLAPETIGTVTVTGSAAPIVGTASTYSASISGNATGLTYAWSTTDTGATIATPTASSTQITFSDDVPFVVTCVVTSGDSSVAGTRNVTPTPVALVLTLSSSDFTDGGALPVDVGVNFTAASPTNPALAWSLTGTNAADVVEYRLTCIDTDAANFVHWNVSSIANTTLSIDATADPLTNNWTGTPIIGATGTPGGAFANGWEPCAPPGGETHNYSFQVQGFDNGGSLIVSSNILTGTYTG